MDEITKPSSEKPEDPAKEPSFSVSFLMQTVVED